MMVNHYDVRTMGRRNGVMAQGAAVHADDQIVPRLQAILTERSSDKVFLRADGAIPYARVVQVMGALNAAGITDIGLVTDMGGPKLGAE